MRAFAWSYHSCVPHAVAGASTASEESQNRVNCMHTYVCRRESAIFTVSWILVLSQIPLYVFVMDPVSQVSLKKAAGTTVMIYSIVTIFLTVASGFLADCEGGFQRLI